MAEEKKDPPKTLSNASNVQDWILSYYGDDAIDYSKKNKIRHIVRTCQFASMCYVISKNSKKAHTDFFESNYTTLDTYYAKAAALVARLLERKYANGGGSLTSTDFQQCDVEGFFKGRDNYATICEDYIGSGGIVEMCEKCFPEPEGEGLRKENESFVDFYKWYDPASKSEKQARALEKKQFVYKNFVKDLQDVRADHSHLLSVASKEEQDSGVLSGHSLHKIYQTTTDKGANMQREWKDKKSKIDFTIRDDIEAGVGIRYNLAKQTTKMAALGGVASASFGAVIGGVFWPAFLLVPAYALAKKWAPDWMKSLGATWGHIEKSLGNRYERQKRDSYYHYIVSFMETGGKPKLRFKDRFFLTPGVIKTLKKGAKSGAESASFEGTDDRTHVSDLHRAEKATTGVMGNLLNATDKDKLVPADNKDLLGQVQAVTVDNASIQTFQGLANSYKTWKDQLPSDFKLDFQKKYSDKLEECAEKLIFETPLDDLNNYKDKIPAYFKEDSDIIVPTKDVKPEVYSVIQRYLLFAKKELTGLEGSWKNKTLKDYILRGSEARVEVTNQAEMDALEAKGGDVKNIVSYIKGLQVRNPDGKTVVSSGGASGIVELSGIQSAIKALADEKDRKTLNDLLKDQLGIVFRNEDRTNSEAAYNAMIARTFTGKTEFDEIFKKIGEMTYENVDSQVYSAISDDLLKNTKITPPEMGRYLRSKIGKAAHDVFYYHAITPKNITKFKEDLPTLIEFLLKLNQSTLLNQQQKTSLTTLATGYIKEAFDKFTKDMSNDFMGVYDRSVIDNYIDSEYSSGGIKTLFKTDSSPETLEVKRQLGGLRGLSSAHTSLKLNGYNMSSTDKHIIGWVLLRDSSKDFDSVKIRDADDKLVDFLSNKLSTSTNYQSFAGIHVRSVESEITKTGTPYSELKSKLSEITTGDMKDCDFYDKYAALVALKNRSVVEFRQCLTKIVTSKCGSSRANDWLQTDEGKTFYAEAIRVWQNGIFTDINGAFASIISSAVSKMTPEKKAEFNEKVRELGVTMPLSDEIKRYGSVYDLALSEEKNLGA